MFYKLNKIQLTILSFLFIAGCQTDLALDINKESQEQIVNQDILSLLTLCYDKDIDVVKTENLYLYDGMIGFSLSQGQ